MLGLQKTHTWHFPAFWAQASCLGLWALWGRGCGRIGVVLGKASALGVAVSELTSLAFSVTCGTLVGSER